MATVIEINNPFEPFEDTVIHNVEDGITVLDWLKKNKDPNWTGYPRPTLCVYNGEPVMQEQYDKIQLKQGDIVSFAVLVGDVVTIIIAIVVAIVAIAAVLAFSQQPPGLGETPEPDPTFTLRGQQNQVKLGQVIPSHYGRIKNWPDYAARPYNQYIGNQQFQYQLFCLGQGSYDISDLRIEDTPIDQFQEIEYQKYEPGEAPNLFPNTVQTSTEVGGIELYGPNEDEYVGNSGPFIANTTETVAHKLEVDVVMPRGLYYSNDDGGLSNRTASAIFEYQQVDDLDNPIGPWLTLDTFSETLATTTAQRFTLSANVGEGRYQVRARRTNDKDTSHRAGNTVVWESLRAFLPNTNDFGDITLVAVKALASNNLNDQSSNRFNLVQERRLSIWNGSFFSNRQPTRNPIWAMVDVLKSEYGAKITDRFIDLSHLKDLADVYESRGDNFDWGFTRRTNVWDACRMILSVGRAIPMLNGSQVTAIRDEPKTIPTAVFSPENMIKGSFRWNVKMFKLNDTDGVEVEYLDEDTWKPETMLCLIGTDEGTNPRKVKLDGVINRDKAYREGLFLRAKMIYQREAIEFTTGLEGHLPNINSLISIVHDVPRWGASGFVIHVDGNELTLSRTVAFVSGQNHKIILRKKDGSAGGPYLVQANPVGSLCTKRVTLLEAHDEDTTRLCTQEPVYFQMGVSENVSKLARVRILRPLPTDEATVEVECVNDDPRIYTFDNETAPPKNTDNDPTVIPDLPVVTGLTVTPIPNVVDKVQVSWNPASGASGYVIELSYDGTVFTQITTVNTTSYILDVTPGYAYIRVAGVNINLGPYVTWEGNVGEASDPPNNVSGLSLQSPFTGSMAILQWNTVTTATSYVVTVKRQSNDAILNTTEVTSNTFTYDKAQATLDFAGFPERNLKFEVLAKNNVDVSDNAQILLVTNPKAPIPSNIQAVILSSDATQIQVKISWDAISQTDIKEYVVWASDTDGFVADSTTEVARGSFLSTTLTLLKANLPPLPADFYYRVAALDSWGDDYNLSTQQSINLS